MKKTSIKDHENLLKVFVILLNYGVIKKDQVTMWTDSILAGENIRIIQHITLSVI